MRIETVKAGAAGFFDVLKRFTENLEGIDKLGGVVQPILALIRLQFGEIVPESLSNIMEDVKSVKSIKNATFCIFNLDEAFKKPIGRDDFKTFATAINAAKRICFAVASFFMAYEYIEKVMSVAVPLVAFPWKMVLLLAGTGLSIIKGALDLQENTANQAKLQAERVFYSKSKANTPDQINKKNAALDAEINKLNTSLTDAFAKNAVSDLAEMQRNVKNLKQRAKESKAPDELKQIQEALAIEKKLVLDQKAKALLLEVNKVAVKKFAEKDKQKEMLKLLKNDKNRNLKDALADVQTLLKMDSKQYLSYKFEVLKVREENLEMARKKAWIGIAFDVTKAAVFILILTKAPVLNLVPISLLNIAKKGIESINLLSGLLGASKFAFESYNKLKEEPRPIFVA